MAKKGSTVRGAGRRGGRAGWIEHGKGVEGQWELGRGTGNGCWTGYTGRKMQEGWRGR